VNLYWATVDELYHPYVKPQENGNRTDVRWVAFSSQDLRGLLVLGQPLLNFSAIISRRRNLTAAHHTHELPRREEISVYRMSANLDLAEIAVGLALYRSIGYGRQRRASLFCCARSPAAPRCWARAREGGRWSKLFEQMALQGQGHRLGAAADPQLGQNAAHVEFDRRAAHDKAVGDLGVA